MCSADLAIKKCKFDKDNTRSHCQIKFALENAEYAQP